MQLRVGRVRFAPSRTGAAARRTVNEIPNQPSTSEAAAPPNGTGRRGGTIARIWTLLFLLLGFGLMLLATRRGWRTAWVAGAGLMGVVVVKLFFFDLDESSPITRIVSFITVGVLMLITGYFSPLPPRNTAKETAV